MGQKNKDNLVVVIVGLILLLGGAFLANFLLLPTVTRAAEAEGWATVQGELAPLNAGIASYTYSVGQKSYSSRNIWLTGEDPYDRNAFYDTGPPRNITVFYDPNDPEQSCLLPYISMGEWSEAANGVLLGIGSFWGLLLALNFILEVRVFEALGAPDPRQPLGPMWARLGLTEDDRTLAELTPQRSPFVMANLGASMTILIIFYINGNVRLIERASTFFYVSIATYALAFCLAYMFAGRTKVGFKCWSVDKELGYFHNGKDDPTPFSSLTEVVYLQEHSTDKDGSKSVSKKMLVKAGETTLFERTQGFLSDTGAEQLAQRVAHLLGAKFSSRIDGQPQP